MRERLLYVEGDSWTRGDEITYDIKDTWGYTLATSNKLQLINTAEPGSSNDGIVRRLTNNISNLLKKYNHWNIHVVIGWSSPERKDFFYNNAWDVTYPAQFDFTDDDKTREDFHRLYVEKYWNEEEYLYRYISSVINVTYFLHSKNINVNHFNAFYENKFGIENGETTNNFVENFYNKKDRGYLKYLHLDNLLEEYKLIYNKYFIDKSFLEYVNEIKTEDKLYFDNYHPTPLSHKKWGEYLSKKLYG